ncbi:MAG: hypothetical protein GPOALKHO_001150 [Sodalis sp.]|nr:MAG: hypothetical protein GPOALKHO_001150 [Sodalis sp.]
MAIWNIGQFKSESLAANENDGHTIATLHEKLDTIDAWTIRVRTASLLSGLSFSQPSDEGRYRFTPAAGACVLIPCKHCCAWFDLLLLTSRPTIWILMQSSD